MKKTVKIFRMDHTGHSLTAEYDPEVQESIEVAQGELTDFLQGCIKQYGGQCPPVFAKRIGDEDFTPFEVDRSNAKVLDNFTEVEEILLQFPLVGG